MPTSRMTLAAVSLGQSGVAQRFDRGALLLVLVFALLLPLSTPRIYATDEVQYYAYVRSVYFDANLDFRNEYTYFAEAGLANGDPAVYNALLRDRAVDPPVHPETGLLRNVAPIGSALLWAPGFVLADLAVRAANLLGAAIPANGFSAPYIWAVCLMSALYALLGLLLTYRLACRVAGPFAALLATLTLWLASPLVFYTFIAMPWSHAPGFFMVALFLTVWLRDADGPLHARLARRSWRTWALLGLLGGLMTMTREQLGLMLIMPAAEGLVAYGRLLAGRVPPDVRAQRWAAVRQLAVGHSIFLLCLALALVPQLATYQILNGQPFPSTTVADKIESAGGLSPHFFATLIHPRHGAFLWSPVLALGLLGLGWLARRDALLAGLLLLAFVCQTYLNGAFGSTWHLSGAFGFRRLIECTPLFALGLAALLAWLRPRIGSVPLLLAGGLLVAWNVGLIAQWAFVRPEMRAGLIWQDMLYYQLVETPRRVVSQLSALLFDRCQLVRNC